MIGYGEVFQTIGAMVIFSLILLSATSMIQRNTYMQVEGELEEEVIALAQDVIEEARTQEFDEVSVEATAPPADIPGNFATSSDLGPEANDDENSDNDIKRHEFDDFDDYNGWEDTITTEQGEFNIRAEVFYVDETDFDSTGTQTTFKKLRVHITSKFLNRNNSGNPTNYKLEFIRNYYAD
ncbi:hypothetical protein [Fodinibius sp. Rm-B-1B1-1]|uniref:type IV pilus modification PilV family protein n=1 Tax=Fodinibius alkaliphilus TaxID=3140241 RepID=UPI00315B2A3B